MTSLLNEIKKEKSFEDKLGEISKLFEVLEKKDFNSNLLRKMQITSAVGTRPSLYEKQATLEMRDIANRLSEEKGNLGKLGKAIYELSDNILKGEYKTLLETEWSTEPTYYPTERLFKTFQVNYGMMSKLF